MAAPIPPLLRLRGMGKTYVTPVLADVDLDLAAGEVLALTGENGAGKSTLSKLIAGLVSPTHGEMQLNGQAYAPASRTAAEALGVRMVMQELSLIPTLTVAENLLLERLPHRAGLIRRKELHALAERQMAAIGLTDIRPDTLVGELGVGHQQMVEIARNLVGDCKLLILDEPTAMLTDREVERLFEQIVLLKARGVGLIYISHRLDELQRIADRVTVLRDGRHIDTQPMASLSQDDIVRRMVGRDVQEGLARQGQLGQPVLRVENLSRAEAVQQVSLTVHAGEIVGVAGLVGAGRTELLRLIFGADRKDGGDVYLNNSSSPARIGSPKQAIAQGIGLITEDRKREGLLLGLPIALNTTLAYLRSVSRRGWLSTGGETQIARRYIDELGVRCQSPAQAVGELSGGNQQKVVLARWLHRDCQVLLLDEPTRGVDIGAREDIYQRMAQEADAGKGLLVVSSDLRELMQICDRIVVMSAGRLAGDFRRGEWSQQALLDAAFSGYRDPQAAAAH
ncbi:sugar ABC transporter ATP-binding protein [Chitinimonas sp.]|uniref:sugar ABC transporter ATP-binding protein n=1 Tax=Chitinimonas sp. TaxID=1934313 RepID=UPI002F94B3D3